MPVQNYVQKYTNYIKKGNHGIRCHINKIDDYYPLHHHNYIEIEFLASGCFEHILNGNKFLCTPGDCWCLDTHDLHMITVLEPVEIYSICLISKDVPETIQMFLSSFRFPLKGHIDIDLLPIITTYFKHLTAVTDIDCSFSREKATAYLLLILTEIIESSDSLSSKSISSSYEHIANAIEFMSQNYSEQITLTDTANAIHLSPNHLSKLFPEVSGKTFLNYLTNIRIDNAKELLTTADTPLTDIALNCGFGSLSAFSRTFKKYKGCSPSTYRERKKKFNYFPI